MINSTCLYSMPRDDVERSMIESFVSHDRAEISSLAKNSKIKTLLSSNWTVDPEADMSTIRSNVPPANMTWKQLSFAAAWRRATLQAKRDRFHLKVEIGKSIQYMHRFLKEDASLNKKFKKMVSSFRSELIELGEKQEEIMRPCYKEIHRFYEEEELDRSSSSDEDEDDITRTMLNWKREMHRHLTACAAICEDLAIELKTLQVLNSEPLSSLTLSRNNSGNEVEDNL